ncbi:MAG: TolC family protein, partial [Planctomycetaceae bacterium]|nr:TolC family protein [Planctomycetaceae bacterium]
MRNRFAGFPGSVSPKLVNIMQKFSLLKKSGRVSNPTMVLSVLSCLLLVADAGCRLPCLRHADPTPVLPEDFNGMSSEENSAHIGIAEFFNDPSLTQLVTYGLSQNQELMIRNEEVEIARNEILSRRGAYLPFVTIGGGGGFDRNSRFLPLGAAEDQLLPPKGTFPDPLSHLGFGPRLFWQVDIWRQLRNARDAAIQRYNEAIEARDYLITKLVAETAENYYELAALDQRLRYLNQTIEIQKQSLEVAQAQKEAARGTE